MSGGFADTQRVFADYMREPSRQPPPEGIEQRRLNIYRDLVFNNIESFLGGTFPILKSLMEASVWQGLVNEFIAGHQCQSPYFLKISEEFLDYLQQGGGADTLADKPFLQELAHYEWVELALDVSEEALPALRPLDGDLMSLRLSVSPLVWSLSYRYPVHLIGPDNQPDSPPSEPTFLIVYRDRQDDVQFMESNAVTVRLLQLLQGDGVESTGDAIDALAAEMGYEDATTLAPFAETVLMDLYQRDVLVW